MLDISSKPNAQDQTLELWVDDCTKLYNVAVIYENHDISWLKTFNNEIDANKEWNRFCEIFGAAKRPENA